MVWRRTKGPPGSDIKAGCKASFILPIVTILIDEKVKGPLTKWVSINEGEAGGRKALLMILPLSWLIYGGAGPHYLLILINT